VTLVKEKCQVVIMGNCDEADSKEYNNEEIENDLKPESITWNQNMLTSDDMEYLRNLPFSYEFYMSGSLIRMFHSSPNDMYARVGNIYSPDKKYELFLPTDKTISKDKADIIIHGHTHTSYIEKFYNRTLINTGSVGNSLEHFKDEEKDANNMETTRAYYLIIEGELDKKEYDNISFQFVRVLYDIDKELSSEKLNIGKESYEKELKEGIYRNSSKIKEYLEKIKR
jgi:protein phosphatase